MPTALLIQPNFNPPGGGNGVAAWMLQALAQEYDVTALTWTQPDLPRINAFFGTSLQTADFELRRFPQSLSATLDALPMGLGLFKTAALGRFARKLAQRHDLVVTANNEICVGRPAVQYVHYPRFSFPRPEVDFHWYNRSRLLRDAYYAGCWRLGAFDMEEIRRNLTLVNSDFIADITAKALGVSPVTLAPPACGAFPDTPWEDRTDDFVCIGRISREKQILDVINVLDGVRQHGVALKLHIVGTDDDPPYYAQVVQRAQNADWIHLKENLPRPELERLVSSCRYGIHGMQGEHFGMVVAEVQQAGCLMFAPEHGGCAEILRDPRLTYSNTEDAQRKITQVMTDAALREELRSSQQLLRGQFSSEQFCRRFRDVVREFRGE